MKKSSKKRQPKRKSNAVAKPEAALASEGRRGFLRWVRNGAIALPVLGGAGYFSVQSVQATICEGDLTKIQNGKPTVVQIHDPSCALCQTLQSQTRKVLRSYDDDSHNFLVANIRTEEGSAFAAQFGVPHVTLLLFDRQGQMKEIVRGPTNIEALRTTIANHLRSPT